MEEAQESTTSILEELVCGVHDINKLKEKMLCIKKMQLNTKKIDF